MLSPIDILTETLKTRLVDGVLTSMANAADSAGSTKLATRLRKLRHDTPFIEDLAVGVRRAVIACSADWADKDPQLAAAIQDTTLWSESSFLADLTVILMRPTAIRGQEFERLRSALSAAAPGAPDEHVTAILSAFLARVRTELFSHPKLEPVHSLYLHVAIADGQAAMLDVLKAIHHDNAAMLSAIRSAAVPGRPAPLPVPEQAPRTAVSAPLAAPRLPPAISARSSRQPPDVLTPTLVNAPAVGAAYGPLVGSERARWLSGVQLAVTDITERGDFAAQETIARQLLASAADVPGLAADGYYLLGEALRLQADLAADRRDQLLAAAMESYSTALELAPDSARALRGLARTHEQRGDAGTALTLFGQARLAALYAFSGDGEVPRNSNAHEVLRATRHYAACLGQRLRDDRSGLRSRESDIRQLHGVVLESEDLHRRLLPTFSRHPQWMYIESFMGMLILGRAYATVKDAQRAWACFLHSLSARMSMLEPTRAAFSPVERANLLWWCRTAQDAALPVNGFGQGVAQLAESVAQGDVPAAVACMQDLTSPVRSPWQSVS